MCYAIRYNFDGENIKVFFMRGSANLPVKTKSGTIAFIKWGRRQTEKGLLPLGPWARLSAIYAGRWDEYLPKPVKLPISHFMQQDFELNTKWYEVVPGQCIQGLLARVHQEKRIYIVTILPTDSNVSYLQWPRILLDNKRTIN